MFDLQLLLSSSPKRKSNTEENMQDSRQWNGIKIKCEDQSKHIMEQEIRKKKFLNLACWDVLVCHSPPLYGSLYGHVKVWDSICRADMARAGWITGVCGYTNSTYLPFNYWLLLFVKNSFNQMAVKHHHAIPFHCYTCLWKRLPTELDVSFYYKK